MITVLSAFTATLHRYPRIYCDPPLIITKSELLDGFDRFDHTLSVLDDALGYSTSDTEEAS
jgi:hypothetical protein